MENGRISASAAVQKLNAQTRNPVRNANLIKERAAFGLIKAHAELMVVTRKRHGPDEVIEHHECEVPQWVWQGEIRGSFDCNANRYTAFRLSHSEVRHRPVERVELFGIEFDAEGIAKMLPNGERLNEPVGGKATTPPAATKALRYKNQFNDIIQDRGDAVATPRERTEHLNPTVRKVRELTAQRKMLSSFRRHYLVNPYVQESGGNGLYDYYCSWVLKQKKDPYGRSRFFALWRDEVHFIQLD